MTKLEWCRLNAPDALKNEDDETVLQLMSSSYEKFTKNKINFVEFQWEPYSLTLNRKAQISHLWGTGLYESDNSAEYCFIPTMKMLHLENRIKEEYEKIVVTDHNISLCNEVFYTSKLEGANTTIKRTQEIHDGKPIDTFSFSENMILGGFKATKLMNIYSNKLNLDIMLKVWNVLVEGSCANEDIRGDKFRIGDVQVGKHPGLRYQFLDEAMNNWISYYNNSILEEHPFIKASLLHFSFEFIHPFCDGNGRLGRLLMINFLIKNGYDRLKAISFSRTIDKNRSQYDYAFDVGDNVYTDCTYFIEYMLQVMLVSIVDAINEI